MKKIIICLFIIMVIVLMNTNHDDYVVIPNNAIRFRIIANSNNIEDQRTKYRIKQELTPILASITNESNDYLSSSKKIEESIPTIDKILNSQNIEYKIDYGNNYFPEKVYKGVKYPAGTYESLVITLGDGAGDNWWCVLFPPLCLLEAKEENLNDYEYTLFIKEIIERF